MAAVLSLIYAMIARHVKTSEIIDRAYLTKLIKIAFVLHLQLIVALLVHWL